MFQYAAARALSLRLGVDLRIDLRFYTGSRDQSRSHWITQFPIVATSKSYENPAQAHGPRARLFNFARERHKTFRSNWGYDPRFENLRDGAVLNGLFQSPRFFCNHKMEISAELNLLKSSNLVDTAVMDRFGVRNLFGVHVRRGDYLTHQSFAMINPEIYYTKVMSEITAAGEKALIFSDDIEWCREQSYFSDAEFFPYRPDLPPFVDMFTMSECKGLYIANSTYSWWAGWFAHQRGVSVAAPTNWILGKRAQDIDLYPDEWRVLD